LEFFAFYRAMQAYEAGLRSTDTRMLLRRPIRSFSGFHESKRQTQDRSAKLTLDG